MACRLHDRNRREEVDLVFYLTRAAWPHLIPFLVGDVFDPVEVRHRGVVEKHVDSAEAPQREIDQGAAVVGVAPKK